MRGLSIQVQAKTVKHVDDILLELLKYKEETKLEGETPAQEDEKTKEENNLISMIKLAMKTKMNATFDLGYP